MDSSCNNYDALHFTPEGVPFLFWHNKLNNTLCGGTAMPGSQNFFDVGDGSYQYYANNLAVDMNGVAHIVYHNSSDKLRYQRWTGNGWTSSASPDHVVEDNEQGWYGGGTSIGFCVGPDGENRAVLYRTLTNHNFYVSTWSTTTETWARELITSREAVTGLGLTYDCKGNLYGLYLDQDSRFHILYGVDAGENLVTDAGFESPLPLRAKPLDAISTYYVEKIKVWESGNPVDAHEGKSILNFRCWQTGPHTVVLKQPFMLKEDTVSFSIWLRARAANSMTVEFGLYDVNGENKLMDLLTHVSSVNNNWEQIQATGLTTLSEAMNTEVRLGFKIIAPANGGELDLDQAGVFEGSSIPFSGVVNNAEFHFIEAEDLANGTSWLRVDHSPSYTWNPASGADDTKQILSGAHSCVNPQDAVWELNVETQGNYKVWCRFYHYALYEGTFTIEVYQHGLLEQSLTINTIDPKYDPKCYYVWESLDVHLDPGPVQVRIKRPAIATSWVSWRLDVLLLTNDLTYDPDIQDLLTPVYMRFTNTSSSGDPFCLWDFVHHDVPSYYTNIGIISKAGESRSYYVPGYPGITAMNTWIGPGESTPWVRITPYLKRGKFMVHKNRLRLRATRSTHVIGYVTEHITGRVEFSVGDNRETISNRIITIDQDGARFWLTVNGDIASHPDEIRSAWEYFNASRIAVDAHMEIHPPIEHIEITAGLALDPQVDDNDLYKKEVEMLLDMGFNNLYMNGPNTDKEGLGLLSESGIHTWSLYKKTDDCNNQPDTDVIESKLDEMAATWAGKTDRVIRSKDGDELMANSIEHVVECSVCQGKFREYLQEDLGLSLAEMGINNWSEAVPTGHADRKAYPALYYYTHMFRFDSFREMAKMCQEKLSIRFPNARNYNNFTNGPIAVGKTWVAGWDGTDLYSVIRNGCGMGWTEDWPGHGAMSFEIDG